MMCADKSLRAHGRILEVWLLKAYGAMHTKFHGMKPMKKWKPSVWQLRQLTTCSLYTPTESQIMAWRRFTHCLKSRF